ncbi:DNA cytosine methyltransferase [Geothrix sp. 21YS21S-2]|uniref:DNA cytosine methyltransferase n=1 Tax=Geothrix sp. 21YS21S-2 TaxID=3068893 RepID=UPI0027B90C6B|nr:DNA cytosine methyltransferase [Geothrix sp. 21YS21S-2]
MRAIELFAGAGGLAIGTAKAGFHHEAVLEWNPDACETIRENKRRKVELVRDWEVVECDVRKYDYSLLGEGIDLVAGGPPCQPFSLGGKHRGHEDERDMFPEAVRAVRELKPKGFMVENVKGLLRQSFASYFGYIILQLTHPEIVKREGEEWPDHLKRLERHHTGKGRRSGLNYQVVFRLLNAADYGVPQRRERVVIVGFREDQFPAWSFPSPTHNEERLIWDQWVTGEYWERHEVAKRRRPKCPEAIKARLDRLRGEGCPSGEAWKTVRDAIADLPDPTRGNGGETFHNHLFNPGARSYPGHTGSPWDAPAKTLKAGGHGVPGGENMLLGADGGVRYFTVRESARLQTFPDEYVFRGAWGEVMRQLGNAVPVNLALAVASSVKAHLMSA